MSRAKIMRKRLAPAVLGIAVALVAGGCAAGQVTQTDSQVAAVNGAGGTVGPIAVRDAVLEYPGDPAGYTAGADAPLLVSIANSGDMADELVSVTTPAAGDVTVEGRATIPSGFAVSSAGDGPDDPTPSATLQNDRPIEGGELRITLNDLTGPIRPGLPTFVTFLFRDAGELTLRVPVANPEDPRTEGTPAPAEEG